MTLTLYGIPNCDTVKKARSWLQLAGIDYVFHDYKKAGIDADVLARWCAALGWEAILNRAGTTFRTLQDEVKNNLDEEKAIILMLSNPSIIKRPVVEMDGMLLVGFKSEIYAEKFIK